MDQKELNLVKVGKIIWEWKIKIIVSVFIITSLSIGVSLLLPKWYKAKAVVLSPQSGDLPFSPMSILGDLGLGSMMGGNENVFRYLAILKSRTLREAIARKYDLQERYECKNMELTLKKMDKNLLIEVGDENQIEISMYDKDQDLVADMTNYVVDCLDSLNVELSVSNARNNRMFMETRVNSVLDSLEFISRKLADFMKENGILSLEDQVVVGIEQASFLRTQIIQKEVELEVSEQSLGKNNPAISRMRYELASLRRKYDDFIKSNTAETLIPNFAEVPYLKMQLIKMQRQMEYYTRLIEFLGPQYEQQKFEEAKNIPTLQVLDEAVRPELKDKPKRAIIVILVFILSGFTAMAYAIVKESTAGNNS